MLGDDTPTVLHASDRAEYRKDYVRTVQAYRCASCDDHYRVDPYYAIPATGDSSVDAGWFERDIRARFLAR